MTINGKILATTGVSGAAMFIVIANNWGPFMTGLAAIPATVSAFSSGMPLGAGSFLLAVAVCPLFYRFIDQWLPKKRRDRHEFLCQSLTILMGTSITVMQQWGATKGSQLVFPIMLGAFAGFLGPLITKGVTSLFRTKKDDTRPDQALPPTD